MYALCYELFFMYIMGTSQSTAGPPSYVFKHSALLFTILSHSRFFPIHNRQCRWPIYITDIFIYLILSSTEILYYAPLFRLFLLNIYESFLLWPSFLSGASKGFIHHLINPFLLGTGELCENKIVNRINIRLLYVRDKAMKDITRWWSWLFYLWAQLFEIKYL